MKIYLSTMLELCNEDDQITIICHGTNEHITGTPTILMDFLKDEAKRCEVVGVEAIENELDIWIDIESF